MKTNESGFTLIESLIVLSIFIIISYIAIFSFKPQYDRTLINKFLLEFQADMFFAQEYAISHQREVTITVDSAHFNYYIRDRVNLPLLIRRKYSKEIKISPGSLDLHYKFLPDGNVNQIGCFFISYKSDHYQFTILLGKGRFYVSKK